MDFLLPSIFKHITCTGYRGYQTIRCLRFLREEGRHILASMSRSKNCNISHLKKFVPSHKQSRCSICIALDQSGHQALSIHGGCPSTASLPPLPCTTWSLAWKQQKLISRRFFCRLCKPTSVSWNTSTLVWSHGPCGWRLDLSVQKKALKAC